MWMEEIMKESYDKIVKGGLLVGPKGIIRADIAIKDGKVEKLT